MTVVDAASFLKHIQPSDTSAGSDRGQRDPSELVNLLVEQVEFANVVVLNKMDLVTQQESGKLRAIVEQLNPKAKILEAQQCSLPVHEVLNTRR